MAQRQSPGQRELMDTQTFFNGQPDVLTVADKAAILKHRAGIKGHLGDLYIEQFDPEGKFIVVQTHPLPKKEAVRVELPLVPPLRDPFFMRPTIHRWRIDAYRKYKVPERPVIDYYAPPAPFPYTLPAIIGLAALAFALFGVGHYADAWRSLIAEYATPHAPMAAAAFVVATHIFIEPLYLTWAMRKHQMPLVPALKWIATTMAIGFGAIDEFWESVQYERIRHIYKQTDVGDVGPRVKPSPVALAPEKKDL